MNDINIPVDKSVKPLTLLGFENNWCAQCYTERPIIQKIANQYRGQLKVQLINAEKELTLANKYQVKTAPSVILLKNGELVERISRFIDYSQLKSLVRYYL